MRTRGAAEFPRPGIRLVVEAEGALAQPREFAEQPLVAGVHQPLVEEQLRQRQDHRAIHVVLQLFGGLVAHAHRAHAEETRQRVEQVFGELRVAGQAVHRLQRRFGGGGHHAVDVVQVAFHGARRAEAVQCLHREVGIAQPAEAVVPVAAAAGELRDRGGERGQQRAGILEGAQLQRDGGAQHFFLPFERHGEAAHPFLPVGAGLLEPARGRAHAVLPRAIHPDRAGRSAAGRARCSVPSASCAIEASVVMR